jgi:hypothetical protein
MSLTLSDDPIRFLRAVLAADAVSAGALGLMLLLAPAALLDLLGLPDALIRSAGLALLPFAALAGWTATRAVPPRAAVWTIIVLNGAWAVESVVTVASGFVGPTPLGVAFVLGQAVLVAAFAVVQITALRRSLRTACLTGRAG